MNQMREQGKGKLSILAITMERREARILASFDPPNFLDIISLIRAWADKGGVFVGISAPFKEISRLPFASRQASEALDLRLVCPGKAVFLYQKYTADKQK